jgi:hypothetical protein
MATPAGGGAAGSEEEGGGGRHQNKPSEARGSGKGGEELPGALLCVGSSL